MALRIDSVALHIDSVALHIDSVALHIGYRFRIVMALAYYDVKLFELVLVDCIGLVPVAAHKIS